MWRARRSSSNVLRRHPRQIFKTWSQSPSMWCPYIPTSTQKRPLRQHSSTWTNTTCISTACQHQMYGNCYISSWTTTSSNSTRVHSNKSGVSQWVIDSVERSQSLWWTASRGDLSTKSCNLRQSSLSDTLTMLVRLYRTHKLRRKR